MKLRLSAILIALSLLFSCKNNKDNKTSANIIPEDKMVSVLVDLHIVEAGITPMQLMGDSLMKYVIDNYGYVFEKNKINDVQFKESLQYYSRHPRQLDKIYEHVIENLNKMQIETQNK